MAKDDQKKGKKGAAVERDDEDDTDAKDKDNAAEGEAETAEDGEEGGKKKFGVKQMLLFGGGGIVLIAALVVGLIFAGIIKLPATEAKPEDAAAAHAAEKKEESEHAFFYDLGEILVNLQSDGRRVNYLKISVSLELADEKDKAAIDKIKPRIMDNFQVYLRELRVEDLRGSAGIYRLREELLTRVTEAAHPAKIRDVLFGEMLVQ